MCVVPFSTNIFARRSSHEMDAIHTIRSQMAKCIRYRYARVCAWCWDECNHSNYIVDRRTESTRWQWNDLHWTLWNSFVVSPSVSKKRGQFHKYEIPSQRSKCHWIEWQKLMMINDEFEFQTLPALPFRWEIVEIIIATPNYFVFYERPWRDWFIKTHPFTSLSVCRRPRAEQNSKLPNKMIVE